MRTRWVAMAACGGLAVICPGLPARADDPAAGLERCAKVTPADARLRCYDGLARQWAGSPAGAEVASAPTPGPVAAAHDAASNDAVSNDADKFGFSPARLHEPPPGPNEVHARVVSLLRDKRGRVSLVLDNGQTWSYGEDDGRLERGDAVTIRRAALGSFLMITPDRRRYHVTRSR